MNPGISSTLANRIACQSYDEFIQTLIRLQQHNIAREIDAIVDAQQNNNDIDQLLELMVDAAQNSLLETLQILATASESRGRGLPFFDSLRAKATFDSFGQVFNTAYGGQTPSTQSA